ncbi:MAG: glycosyltransferase family 39 protein, partial [Anaerolineae bacterium]
MQDTLDIRRRRIESNLYLGLALLALTIVAGALRWQALVLGPQALYRDEAQNGLDALRVLAGARPVFFEANNGREPLFIYLSAAAVALFGRSPNALRLVSLLVGTLTVPALYWLGAELYGRRVGLMAAILSVSTVWLLNLSRVAFRAGLLPLIASLALAAAWHAQRHHSRVWASIGGALFGLTLYTYLAARAIPIALGSCLLWCLLDRRTRRNTWWQGWALALVCALAIGAPLLIYLVRTGALQGRSDQVSILNPAINGGDLWAALARSAGRTVRSLAYGGDFIPRHNVPWRPVFAPVLAVAAYAGLGLTLIRSRREPCARLVLAWLVALALPTILAEGAPHFLRGAGALPAVLLLPGVALDAALTAARGHWRRVVLAGAALAVGWGAWDDWGAYRTHLASPAVYYEFESGAAELAVAANRHLGTGWQGNELLVVGRAPIPGREVWIA